MENSIMWLERACDFSVHFDTYEINHHTTPLLKNIQEAGGIRVDGKSRSEILLQELKEIKGIDKIIDDERVKNAFLKLEKAQLDAMVMELLAAEERGEPVDSEYLGRLFKRRQQIHQSLIQESTQAVDYALDSRIEG